MVLTRNRFAASKENVRTRCAQRAARYIAQYRRNNAPLKSRRGRPGKKHFAFQLSHFQDRRALSPGQKYPGGLRMIRECKTGVEILPVGSKAIVFRFIQWHTLFSGMLEWRLSRQRPFSWEI